MLLWVYLRKVASHRLWLLSCICPADAPCASEGDTDRPPCMPAGAHTVHPKPYEITTDTRNPNAQQAPAVHPRATPTVPLCPHMRAQG